jgi:uncharacterized membrane protein (DUF106 family)
MQKMQKFTLSDERKRLLQKVVKKRRDPIEIALCTVVALLMFIWVYCTISNLFRHEEPFWAFVLGPVLAGIACLAFCFIAYRNVKNARAGHIPKGIMDRRNLWVNLAICSLGAVIAGFILGDRDYWLYGTNYYSYSDLVSYVDIDPAKDSGQAYMDSGHVYFKDHSYVLRQKFNRFRNGDTYCVAPIVRGAFVPNGTSGVQTMNGFTLPESGTYDWWAVGTNCCEGNTAANFTCGQVTSNLARSGMRLLSDSQRPYYLLAVQEWSATYGLPVKHPLFFTWVKDPLATEERLEAVSDSNFWYYTWWFLLCAFIVSFLLHMIMHQNKIY